MWKLVPGSMLHIKRPGALHCRDAAPRTVLRAGLPTITLQHPKPQLRSVLAVLIQRQARPDCPKLRANSYELSCHSRVILVSLAESDSQGSSLAWSQRAVLNLSIEGVRGSGVNLGSRTIEHKDKGRANTCSMKLTGRHQWQLFEASRLIFVKALQTQHRRPQGPLPCAVHSRASCRTLEGVHLTYPM